MHVEWTEAAPEAEVVVKRDVAVVEV